MNRNDIRSLNAQGGYPAISILLPTHRTTPDNRQDPIRLKNLVRQARDRLQAEIPKREAEPLLQRLDTLVKDVDHARALDGLALFVSPKAASQFVLPFPLKERVVIDQTFATRDLVYALNRSVRYWLVSLSEQHTRFYEGVRDALAEIKTEPFPMSMDGPGATEPLPGGKGIEPTKYLDQMHRQFLRKVDAALNPWLTAEPLPLVVAGVEHYLAQYREVTSHGHSMLATVSGNFSKTSAHDLARSAWPLVEAGMAERRRALLQQLEEAASGTHVVSGVGPAWRAAHEGRVDLLLVEQDYAYAARVDPDGLTLAPAEDATAPGVIDDAVDELVETVLAKGGRVEFVDNEALAVHQGIAAIQRY